MLLLVLWSLVFAIALAIVIKSANWLALGAQKLAERAGLTALEAGLVVVSVGTSLPELALAIAAVQQGISEIAVALAVGSSVANILLIAGISAIAARTLAIKEDLVNSDASFFAISIVLFFFAAQDGSINALEGAVMLAALLAYIIFVLSTSRRGWLTPKDLITPAMLQASQGPRLVEVLPTRLDRQDGNNRKRSGMEISIIAALGLVGLVVGAHFGIKSMITIAGLLGTTAPLAAMVILAVSASLPELFAAVKTASRKRYEITLGNIFGANIFNLLLVCGASAMFSTLKLDAGTLAIGLPFMMAASVLLLVSCLSRRINLAEGVMYLLAYAFFIVKLFNLF